MPFVVFKKINYNILNGEEEEYFFEPENFKNDIDEGHINFDKIRNGIKKLHKKLINDFETGEKYMKQNYNFSERNVILYSIGGILYWDKLHNLSPKQIKNNFKDYNQKSLKNNLTFDIQITI